MRIKDDVTPVTTFSRQEFLENRWDYSDGEHVTMLAPTQNGKTTTAFDLIQHLPQREKQPVILVMKPRDKTITKIIKQAPKGYFKVIRSWPPIPSPWSKPRAYVLWPKHTFDPDRDDVILKGEFEKAVRSAYKGGDRIVMADETYGLMNELKMSRLITAVHSRGAGMGVGIWCMTQKPTHIGTWAYSQAEHLFLGHDPDERARKRFSEIGGVDPEIVKHYVANLKKYQWFYIRRTGPVMCIIDSK